jgi:hypothetical protein
LGFAPTAASQLGGRLLLTEISMSFLAAGLALYNWGSLRGLIMECLLSLLLPEQPHDSPHEDALIWFRGLNEEILFQPRHPT